MNKADLTNFVAEETEMTKKDARIAVNTVIDGIAKGLIEDNKVTLVGFGSFTTAERAARKGRNPKTGEEIDIPAKTLQTYKQSTALKDSVYAKTLI
jgi:DNA-binding protein HU-beta